MTLTQRAKPFRPARQCARSWALALLLALGACQAPKPSATDTAAVPPVPGAPAAAASDPATAALPPEPFIDDNPQRLMGLTPAALSTVLGEPELVRREAPAEIWQYRNDNCVLDVFLYDTAGRREVTYVEARDGTAQKIEASTCLNELLRARLTQPLG